MIGVQCKSLGEPGVSEGSFSTGERAFSRPAHFRFAPTGDVKRRREIGREAPQTEVGQTERRASLADQRD
jgi:hypothetical protein